ncbi:hypothetical protein PTSG_11982 [Salpingoeca rosetta]|uniref:RING-type E3 ubiquitin transferase n=1 Tax=Salpingoeca rosetta (strain ATCC 50818 / BSB-021) TaxID=946362 RepID=F2U4M6_SALR5|nr:uncharacterized protein PTSG_11982 [Salpingoeca rosetta]EGD82592.1 hypothetical protein PTSG_11982 [Salpingoeca rosetta]|eukprot:XP_004995828.1 hypothetical protein PTSG_11982 [Salpingoeca rosetta]
MDERAEKVDGLTEYEQQRQPQKVISDGRSVSVPIHIFNEEVRCPICLGLIENTYTAMSCLHRFCAECIQKCLRLGKKECPTCRAPLASRRRLRRDDMFDQIISTVYPSRDIYDEQQSALVDKTLESSNRQFLVRAMVEGMMHQAKARQRAKGAGQIKTLGRNLHQDVNVAVMAHPRIIEASLQLQLVSKDVPLNHSYLNTTPEITGAVLKKFLAKDCAHHPSTPLELTPEDLHLAFESKPIDDATCLATLTTWSPATSVEIEVSRRV